MSLYSDLTDAELDAKIVMLRGKVEEVALGGVARVVAGEGRRIEYSAANSSKLEALYAAAVRERDSRAGELVDGAIPVYFPYGGDSDF